MSSLMMETPVNPLGNAAATSNNSDLPPVTSADVTRHTLQAEEELRIEVPFGPTHACTITLQQGSCELYGVELALQKPITYPNGGLQIALFTWHGCVVDVDCASAFCYTSDETDANVAYVNTHAQLEALRDQAAAAHATLQLTQQTANASINIHGPRVLVCGPPECGKSTLCKLLAAYACKLGRTPLLVELDPTSNSNLLAVPGTMGACPLSRNALTAESLATCTGVPPGTAAPLLLWHGMDPTSENGNNSKKESSSSKSSNAFPLSPELYKAQIQTLAERIEARLTVTDTTSNDPSQENELSSGIICNTPACLVEGEGFPLLQHAIDTLQIDVVLVLGHDRLYSMLKRHCQQQEQSATSPTTFTGKPPKVIKLPRSGGVVSRDDTFQRRLRNQAIKHYFYGSLQERVHPTGSEGNAASTTDNKASSLVPQLTPFLLQIPMDQVTVYKFSSIRLSASLLPVASAQTSEAIQLVKVLPSGDDTEDSANAATTLLPHHVLAVCHLHAVQQFEQSGKASDLYQSGVAGFCVVERIVLDKLHLLTPCAGSLPSHVLLMGNVVWME